MSTIAEQIMANVATALGNITEANGYLFDATVKRLGALTLKHIREQSPFEDKTVVLVPISDDRMDDAETRSAFAGSRPAFHELAFATVLSRRVSETDAATTPLDQLLLNGAGEVCRALLADPQRNSLAERTDWESDDLDVPSSAIVSTFTVRYATDFSDPRSQSWR